MNQIVLPDSLPRTRCWLPLLTKQLAIRFYRQPKQCFYDAVRVTDYLAKGCYVEGYLVDRSNGFFFEHAWWQDTDKLTAAAVDITMHGLYGTDLPAKHHYVPVMVFNYESLTASGIIKPKADYKNFGRLYESYNFWKWYFYETNRQPTDNTQAPQTPEKRSNLLDEDERKIHELLRNKRSEFLGVQLILAEALNSNSVT